MKKEYILRKDYEGMYALSRNIFNYVEILLIVPGETFVPYSASEMSSTRRTDTPARYISMSASSIDVPYRLYRSMMAVSNVTPFSFGIIPYP